MLELSSLSLLGVVVAPVPAQKRTASSGLVAVQALKPPNSEWSTVMPLFLKNAERPRKPSTYTSVNAVAHTEKQTERSPRASPDPEATMPEKWTRSTETLRLATCTAPDVAATKLTGVVFARPDSD